MEDTFYNLALRRRSIRRYTGAPVERTVLEAILKTALTAPCSFGHRPVEFVAVEGEENPELLALTLNSLHALDKMPDKPLPLVKAAFEWKAMALAGYEPLIDSCGVCGAVTPEEPRFHLREGVLHCAKCRDGVGEGEPLKQLADAAEAYLHTQLERGFSTLDYYKSLQMTERSFL